MVKTSYCNISMSDNLNTITNEQKEKCEQELLTTPPQLDKIDHPEVKQPDEEDLDYKEDETSEEQEKKEDDKEIKQQEPTPEATLLLLTLI